MLSGTGPKCPGCLGGGRLGAYASNKGVFRVWVWFWSGRCSPSLYVHLVLTSCAGHMFSGKELIKQICLTSASFFFLSLSACCSLGIVLKAKGIVLLWSQMGALSFGIYIVICLLLLVRNPGIREVEWLAQDHSARGPCQVQFSLVNKQNNLLIKWETESE